MTQVFNEDGVCQAATILRVSPVKVTQVKQSETDGYQAVKLAYGEQKEHRIAKAQKGQLGNAAGSIEFRPRDSKNENIEGVEVGAEIDASIFAPGDMVAVSAVSKGKGFQGVVKRHGFHGGPKSHGQKHSHREPGSIGATGPARVFKGVRMAGRMGSDKVTVKNLTVLQVNKDENLILIAGAVPGRKGSLVEVRGIN